jgi:hypothetical protein
MGVRPATGLNKWADTLCLKMGTPEDDEKKADRVSRILLWKGEAWRCMRLAL